MNLKEIDRPPIVGKFNIQYFVIDASGRLFLKRIPKENLALLEQIKIEYTGTQFLTMGGHFRRRTPQEQSLFAKQAASHKLRVLAPEYMSGEIAYYPFIEKAQMLDTFFRQPTVKPDIIISQLLNDLRIAHAFNVIYGDRWHPNILVAPKIGIIHIDFDIEISGSCAKEFEVAQVVYYTVFSGKDTVVSPICKCLSAGLWCDPKLVAHFLQAKTVFFKSTEYGGIESPIKTIIAKSLNK